jgi:hypothetical protein
MSPVQCTCSHPVGFERHAPSGTQLQSSSQRESHQRCRDGSHWYSVWVAYLSTLGANPRAPPGWRARYVQVSQRARLQHHARVTQRRRSLPTPPVRGTDTQTHCGTVSLTKVRKLTKIVGVG